MKKTLTIIEICRSCQVDEDKLRHFLNEEWITPEEEEIFDEEDVARLRFINHLLNEFGVNEEGVPIILHLVDQLNRLHLEIGRMRN